ncbi:hypothetical protein JMA_39970 (plasmid) [Jeotgalibacillus malaysiensis]|uniref:RNA polymerase sigma-70 region 4 domain-containing protein n=1 Tax=Jeotgalibacillus malaysiensis TaxID=1508404 RepID=A0A0B5AT18_9BACL|nr:sigma-70 family RNA polymerase sigma factor [Jeotgalibacillus malaysiensis]AJD93315.1 hypothetical protein JMA_39970 [Jeotgalibacillus malaysiensis]
MNIEKSIYSELSEPLIESIKRMQFVPEKTHLPLANSPERFLDMLMYLAKKESKEERVDVLSDVFTITTRQINFYAETGDRTFGLFDRTRKGYVRLTEIGESVYYLPEHKRLAYLQHKLLMLPYFREIKQRITHITTNEVVNRLSKDPVFRENFSDSSLKRRAGTLLSWAKWFEKHQISMDDNELSDYIQENQDLIHWTVHGLNRVRLSHEDAYGIAMIGLQKALMHYDEKRENKFSTFAVTCMKNEIRMIRRKERAWNKNVQIGIDEKPVSFLGDFDAGDRTESMFSLSERTGGNELTTEESYIHQEEIQRMMAHVESMPEREKTIVREFYFNEKSQKEIGLKLKMSQANVSKVIQRIHQTIKKLMLEQDEVYW